MKATASRAFIDEVRRRAADRSQKDLALAIGRTQPFVSQLLSGKRVNITLETAASLSAALGISLDRVVARHMHRKSKRLTAAQLWLLDPPPGSKAAKAKAFGVDLTLNARLLGLTTEQRIAELRHALRSLRAIDGKRSRTRV
jgi:transcriptional regulator with XRE-family HTH domain